jgi:hypothetical protein
VKVLVKLKEAYISICFGLLSICLVLIIGCQVKSVKVAPIVVPVAISTPVPQVIQVALPTPVPTVEAIAAPRIKSYLVVKGDCLWNISAKKEVYGSPWYWPIIYKWNRTEISNPNLIYRGQRLQYPAEIDPEEKLGAILQARKAEWPRGDGIK